MSPRPVPAVRASPRAVDVARRAGVSVGTVSNVLNYPERVVPSTLDRVRKAMDELGYVRNDAARALSAGRSASIGFVVADIENTMFVDFLQGAQAEASDTGLTVLLGNASCSLAQQDAYLDLFDEARVAGLLLAPMEDSTQGVARMRSHGRQIVLLNYEPGDADTCAVLVDNEAVGYLAARHLIDGGRRRLLYAATHEDYQPVHQRRLGVRRAVAEAPGVALEEFETGGLQRDAGLLLGRSLLDRSPGSRPDGVVCVTDAMAYGLLEAALESGGPTVPADLAVVGCEGNRATSGGPIQLTTIAAPGREMGRAAFALLLEEMGHAAQGPGAHRHQTVVLAPSVVVGRSS